MALPSQQYSARQQEEPLLLLSCLPEALQLQVLGMSTVKDCLSLSLSNRWSYREIWENSRLWQVFLQGLDAQRQDLTILGAMQLRDKFRWEHFGINILASGKELVAADKCAVLQRAERAVRAMLPKDHAVADRITTALGAIIANATEQSGRAVPEQYTKALISAVTTQDEVFTLEQTMDLVSAQHQLNARSQPRQPRHVQRKTRLPRQQSGSAPASPSLQKHKPPKPPAAFNDEVMGRLSFMLQDVASEMACAPAA